MAKPELTQKEMQKFIDQDKTHIWQYNTLYQIEYSPNIEKGEYYLRKIIRKSTKGMGVTRRGRFMAMTRERAEKYL